MSSRFLYFLPRLFTLQCIFIYSFSLLCFFKIHFREERRFSYLVLFLVINFLIHYFVFFAVACNAAACLQFFCFCQHILLLPREEAMLRGLVISIQSVMRCSKYKQVRDTFRPLAYTISLHTRRSIQNAD